MTSRFDRNASIVPTQNRTGWTSEEIHEISEAFVAFAAGAHRPVLDVGAAYGVATIPALATGARVIAVDSCAEHLGVLEGLAPSWTRHRLQIICARFPDELAFEPQSLSAIHASNILHFLIGDDIARSLKLCSLWLEHGGQLFILVNTPFAAYFRELVQDVERARHQNAAWPGEIHNLHGRASAAELRNLPDFIHLLTADILAPAVERAGFRLDHVEEFTRRGIPPFARLHGRENLGIVATKLTPK